MDGDDKKSGHGRLPRWGRDHSPACTNLLRGLAFITAMLSCVAAFSMFAFLTYLGAIKDTFDYSQSQVELLMAFDWLGMGVTFPVGAFLQRYGVRAGSVLALILSGGSNLLIWSACNSVTYYHHHNGLLGFYFFLAGCGCGTTYLTAMAATMPNFAPQYRGTVVGMLSSGTSTGPLLFIWLYFNFFCMGGFVEDAPTEENVQGYFLLVSICFISVHVLGLIFYGDYPPSINHEEKTPLVQADLEKPKIERGMEKEIHGYDQDSSQTVVSLNGDASKMAPPIGGNESTCVEKCNEINIDDAPPIGLCRLLSDPVFHFIAWPAIIIMALVPMDANNTGTYLESFRIPEYTSALAYLGPAIAFVFSISIGFISDLMGRYSYRAIISLVNACIMLIIYFFSIFFLSDVPMLFINIALVNASFPAAYCITPVLLTEEYGLKSFSRSWGIVHFGYAVGGFIAQAIMGQVYDVFVLGDNTCYGQICYQYTFVGATLAVFIAVVLTLLYFKYSKAVQRKRQILLSEDI